MRNEPAATWPLWLAYMADVLSATDADASAGAMPTSLACCAELVEKQPSAQGIQTTAASSRLVPSGHSNKLNAIPPRPHMTDWGHKAVDVARHHHVANQAERAEPGKQQAELARGDLRAASCSRAQSRRRVQTGLPRSARLLPRTPSALWTAVPHAARVSGRFDAVGHGTPYPGRATRLNRATNRRHCATPASHQSTSPAAYQPPKPPTNPERQK